MTSKQFKIKICQITTGHRAFDDRIFHKECKTLANAGFDTSLIAHFDKDDVVDDVKIISLPKAKNRFDRIFGISFKAFRLALKQKSDVYHFHDPELLPLMAFLKLITKKKVIYDVHEDYEKKILSRDWIKGSFRKIISFSFRMLESFCATTFDYIITADSHTKMKFNSNKTEVVANFVPLSFTEGLTAKKTDDVFKIIYAGGISKDRGIYVMIETMKYLQNNNIELHLLGEIDDKELIDNIKTLRMVKYHGWLPWTAVSQHLLDADVGLILLQPVPAYLYYPGENIIKLFEYMSTGLAILISNFPKLSKFISDINCGIPVDPTNPKEIAKVIEHLYKNPDLKREMGENGKKAILNKYNWDNEQNKLIRLYHEITINDN